MAIQSVFAANMRKFRKAAGLTQERLAELSGLHRTYIGGIEQKRINISIKNAERIANALEINPALLFLDYGDNKVVEEQSSRVAKIDAGLEISKEEAEQTQYALCCCTQEKVTLYGISVDDIDLSTQILCGLISNGCTHEDIAQQYQDVKNEVAAFIAKKSSAQK